MSGENEPVRRYEFGLYRQDVERRLSEVERTVRQLDTDHDEDMDALAQRDQERAKQAEERSRWTWQQLVAVVSAGAVVGALALQAAGR